MKITLKHLEELKEKGLAPQWLSLPGYKTLKAGYLLEGEEPSDLYARLSDAACKHDSSIDRMELYDMLWHNHICPASPVLSNFGTDRGLNISCLTGDMWVSTSNGAKLVREVSLGDKLLTHRGNWKPVSNIMARQSSGDLYELVLFNRTTRTKITGNHPVLTKRGWVRVDELQPDDHIKLNSPLVKGPVKVNHIKPNKHKYNNNRCKNSGRYVAKDLPDTVQMTDDLAWFFGLWVAEGSLTTNNGRPNGIRVTLNIEEEHLAQRWLDIGNQVFGANGNYYISNTNNGGWLSANINSTTLGEFFKGEFGTSCKTKRLPKFVYNMTLQQMYSFLSGVIVGDGTIDKQGGADVELANPGLVHDLYDICLYLGYNVSLRLDSTPSKGATVSNNGVLIIRNFHNTTKFDPYKEYTKIKSLRKLDYDELVYDFTVDDDHSFSVNGFVVHNCFGGAVIPDSVVGVMDGLKEVAMQSKLGGGTAIYMGEVRPRGSAIKGNGVSNGIIPFLKMFDSVILGVSQGGVRRGAMAAYLPIEHGDIEEFIDMRRVTVEEHRQVLNIHHGVCISNEWMEDLIKGKEHNRAIWRKLIKARLETGEPYLFFKEAANRHIRQGECLGSNLCLTEDQRVVTTKGYLTVKELYESGEELVLFSGSEAVKSSPMLLRNEDAEILKITYSNGMTQKVTFNHGIPVFNDTRKDIVRVEAKDLKVGDYVALQTNKGLFGELDMQDEAYLLGLYQSDGTQDKDSLMIDVWENDFDLIDDIQEKFNRIHYKYGCDTYGIKNKKGDIVGLRNKKPATFFDSKVNQSLVKKKRLVSRTLKKALNFEKGYVPSWIWESNEDTIWAYLRGLLYADGTVFKSSSNGEPIQIAYADINKEFLSELQILFTNLGLSCSIRLLRKEGESLLPDGKGGHKYYTSKDCWRLIFGSKNDALIIEEKTGFLARKNIIIEDREYRDNTKKRAKVVAIEQLDNEPVYCPTIDNDEHIFVSNGLRTFNCNEIYLPTDHNKTFVCCLSSLNLEYYSEWKPNTVEVAMKFLNAAMSEFIQKSEGIPGMERAWRFAKESRALGLGVLGWHSYLQSNMIPFESFQAMQENNKIFRRIWEEAQPVMVRNKNQYGLAIAPTVSNSLISGHASSGVEPLAANTYQQNSSKGTFTYRNKHLKSLMRRKGIHKAEIWRDILAHEGSIQHLDLFDQEEKEVFKTAREINMMSVVAQAGQRQNYIDQGQSINLYFPINAPLNYINNVHLEAWRQGLKGLYYCRTSSALSGGGIINYEECKSCGG